MQESFWYKFGQKSIKVEIMSISCSALILVNGKWRPSWNAKMQKKKKKKKRLHIWNIMEQSWINFNQWFLRYCHFCVYAIFSNGPGGHLERCFYTPPHVSGGVLCFHVGRPCVCPSVRPSVRSMYVRPSALRFRSITEVFVNGFHSNFAYAIVPTMSRLGSSIGKFR